MGGGGDSHRRGNTRSHRPRCFEDVVDDRRLMHFMTLCLAGLGLRIPQLVSHNDLHDFLSDEPEDCQKGDQDEHDRGIRTHPSPRRGMTKRR